MQPKADIAMTSAPASTLSPPDNALIARYDVPAPRYTSYPTALEFREDFGPEQFRAAISRRGITSDPLSLYVHLPFCASICYYCACNKIVTRQRESLRDYLTHLAQEVRLLSGLVGSRRPVTQMHWGGGTPTYLNPAELTELMHLLASHFRLLDSNSREYAIEIDPRSIDRDTLALLKGLGFNRVSFGVQDFDPQVQQAINRVQPFSQVASLCEAARSFGFRSMSLDLIYGLPLQTTASMGHTIDQVIALRPDRIALYNYAHLPERFSSQRALDRLPRPDAMQKLQLLGNASARLIDAGYRHIGMDHFVLPGDDLALAQDEGRLQRNFQGYSACLAPDTLGLGVSAISSFGDCYAANHRDLDHYRASLERGEPATGRGLVMSADDQLRRHVILQIICQMQLDFGALRQLFGIQSLDYFADELNALRHFAADGLLQLGDSGLQVTERGRPMLRNICMVFDRYRCEHATGHFSKVI